MPTVTLRSTAGASVGEVELPPTCSRSRRTSPSCTRSSRPSWPLVERHAEHEDRSEVLGGGKKPFKQKGTGNARQGSTRAPTGWAAEWRSARSRAATSSAPQED